MATVDESNSKTPGLEAVACVKRYIAAFNERDAPKMCAAFNFPHIRLAKGEFTIIEQGNDFVERQALVTRLLVEEGWHHTVIESWTVVHEGPDKVHLDIEYTRRDAADQPYERFKTLWIATHQGGKWGIQFRSSFLESDASTLGPTQ